MITVGGLSLLITCLVGQLPPTPTAPPSRPAVTELLPNPDFVQGAAGWTLVAANAAELRGPDEKPAVLLNLTPDDEWSTVSTSIYPVPVGRLVELSVRTRAAARRQQLWMTATARRWDLADEAWVTIEGWREKLTPPLDSWQYFSMRMQLPAASTHLILQFTSHGKLPILVAQASLRVVDGSNPTWAPDKLGSLSIEALDTTRRELADRVEQIRGLSFGTPTTVRVVTRQTLAGLFRAVPDSVRSSALRLLGIWPDERDLLAVMFDLLGSRASGLYLMNPDCILLAADLSRERFRIVLAHELTHALDERHFRYSQAPFARRLPFDDVNLGGRAVIEGSATLVMGVFMQEELAAGRLDKQLHDQLLRYDSLDSPELETVPRLLRALHLTSYALGARFLLRGEAGRTPSDLVPGDLDRAHRAPPRSTEQLLHPEKYWDEALRDEPVEVELPDLSSSVGPGWQLAGTGQLGELVLAAMLGCEGPDDVDLFATDASSWTTPAAAGWGGDRWQLYEQHDQQLLLLATVWDTEQDAVEFDEAVGWRSSWSVAREGQAVVVVVGPDGFQASRVVGATLDVLTD